MQYVTPLIVTFPWKVVPGGQGGMPSWPKTCACFLSFVFNRMGTTRNALGHLILLRRFLVAFFDGFLPLGRGFLAKTVSRVSVADVESTRGS